MSFFVEAFVLIVRKQPFIFTSAAKSAYLSHYLVTDSQINPWCSSSKWHSSTECY